MNQRITRMIPVGSALMSCSIELWRISAPLDQTRNASTGHCGQTEARASKGSLELDPTGAVVRSPTNEFSAARAYFRLGHGCRG
jgi:hypothetical protein